MSKLDDAIRNINRGKDRPLIRENKDYEGIEKIPFPSPKINWQLYGGLPLKRITEIAGEDGSGKTTTALGFCGEAQKMFPEKRAIYIDAEHTLDMDWAEKLGVDTENLIVMSPETETAEEILDYIIELVGTGEVSVVVLDSIPSLLPKSKLNESVGKKTYGGISLPLTEFCKQIIRLLIKHNTSLFIINQVREDIDNPFNNFRTPGGRALKHYSALRIFSKKGSLLDKDYKKLSRNAERPIGHLIELKIVKTKVSKPNRPFASYTLNFMEGIDQFEDTIETAVQEKVIAQAGAWYRLIDPDTGEILTDDDGEQLKFHGKTKLRAKLEEDEELYKMIKDHVNKRVSKLK